MMMVVHCSDGCRVDRTGGLVVPSRTWLYWFGGSWWYCAAAVSLCHRVRDIELTRVQISDQWQTWMPKYGNWDVRFLCNSVPDENGLFKFRHIVRKTMVWAHIYQHLHSSQLNTFSSVELKTWPFEWQKCRLEVVVYENSGGFLRS